MQRDNVLEKWSPGSLNAKYVDCFREAIDARAWVAKPIVLCSQAPGLGQEQLKLLCSAQLSREGYMSG